MKLSEKLLNILKTYMGQFSREEGYFEDDIRVMDYFKSHPQNTDVTEVVLKLSAVQHPEIDHIVKSRSVVAKHIVGLQIDERLQKGEARVVNEIARLELDHQSYFLYAFATRYCNYHRPNDYPIYDTTIEKILKLYFEHVLGEKLTEQQIKDYPTFKNCMLTLREELNMNQYNFKEIDKFVWIYGDTILREISA